MDTKSSGPGLLVWILAIVAIVTVSYFGWRSNQRPTNADPAQAPATAPESAKQRAEPAPVVTETNGGLPG